MHAFLHAPQLLGSRVRSTHPPSQVSVHTHPASTQVDGRPKVAVHATLAPGSSSITPSQLSSLPSQVSGTGAQTHVPGSVGPVTIGPPDCGSHFHPARHSSAPQQGSEHTVGDGGFAPPLASKACTYVHKPDWQLAPDVQGLPTSLGCADMQRSLTLQNEPSAAQPASQHG
jgi:hypothetical protein